MGLLNGSLHIGKNAISASQAALTVIGNNMANAATPSYSRQNPILAPTQYTEVVTGRYTGTGVALVDIRRQVDDALNARICVATGDSASNYVQQQALTRVEALFNELTDQDISTRLNAFFDAWSDVQNEPQDSAARSVVLQEGRSLSNFIREVRSDLVQIQSDLDAELRFQVSEANSLITQISDLNEQVVVAEAGRAGSAAALRDQRDDLLKQLSGLVNINVHEMEGGAVSVYIGNDPVIEMSGPRLLSYKESFDSSGNKLAQIAFADNNRSLDLSGGKIHGLITSRDNHLGDNIDELDTWTSALIFEVNKVHCYGQGLQPFSSVSASYVVEDTTAALSDIAGTGLDWAADNGVFYITVTDSGTTPPTTTRHQIKVDVGVNGSDTTMDDLVAAIDAVANISASVDASGRLSISADASRYTFGFQGADDAGSTSNVLAVLGINNYFEGTKADDIDVRSDLTINQIAASIDGILGNGDIAGTIASLGNAAVSSLNGSSIVGHYTDFVGDIAAQSKNAQDNYKAADVVVQTLESERQGISGVSVDEEAINMITFQRAFQGASRYVTLVDEMLTEILGLI